VFFPVYCEEKNIDKMVHKTVEVLEGIGLKNYEVIIVNDGSTDTTAEVAEQLAGQYEKVRVIHHEKNLGYGTALATGFKAAVMDYILYLDGDNQYDLEDIRKFVALMPHTDAVIGFRIRKQYNLYRLITSTTYNLVVRFLFHSTERDINCAFKLFPRQLFNRIELESRDYFIDAEMVIKARKLNYRITEIGVTHLPRVHGVSSATHPLYIFRVVKEIIYFYRKIGPLTRP
jgi:glycosyltransferase involved in cell wall biosynthesis